MLLDYTIEVDIKMQKYIDQLSHTIPLTVQIVWHINHHPRSPIGLLAKQ